jgi:NAD(P)-dependent dehydrogenase (short-subunit alcohol dehydrogenase family)
MTIFSTDLLDGKVALITGGGSGINFGIARALVDHGASVSLVSRTQEKLDRAAEALDDTGERARGFAADVRDEDALRSAIDATVEAFGKLDILVNGAAGNFLAPAAQLSPNGFKAVLDIDACGTFNASRLCFEHLMQSEGAVVLNISANQAWIPTPLQVHAGAAKAAVQKMTQDLALEWGPAGIRVVGIAPGPIEGTEGMKRLSTTELRDRLVNQLPVRRFGTADEIGTAAVFLCSDAASFITGTTLVVDGGQSLVGAAAFLDMLG